MRYQLADPGHLTAARVVLELREWGDVVRCLGFE
jgi:hypothetical protein